MCCLRKGCEVSIRAAYERNAGAAYVLLLKRDTGSAHALFPEKDVQLEGRRGPASIRTGYFRRLRGERAAFFCYAYRSFAVIDDTFKDSFQIAVFQCGGDIRIFQGGERV